MIRKLLPLLLTLTTLVEFGRMAWAQEGDLPHHVFLPLALPAAPCVPTGASYGTLTVEPPPTDRPAAQHPDLLYKTC